MDSELMRYANGEVRPSLQDRRRAARARGIRNDVQEGDFKIRAIGALIEDAMDVMSEVDDHRDKVANGNPAKNTILAQFELDAAQAIREVIAETVQQIGQPRGRRLSWLRPSSTPASPSLSSVLLSRSPNTP